MLPFLNLPTNIIRQLQQKVQRASLLPRIIRRERRAARLLAGVEVHQLHANSIGVVEVELAFAIFADLSVVLGITPVSRLPSLRVL